MERKVYVLMFNDDDGRAMFATTTRKREALSYGRRIKATVYAIPYPGQGWDCPTIRATFDPIARY